MEINEAAENESHPVLQRGGEMEGMSENVFLDHVGEVVLTLNSDKLCWKLVKAVDKELIASSCIGIKLTSKNETEINISDAYAVEFINWGLIHDSVLPNGGGCLLGRDSEMYRFTVHGYQKSKKQPSLCVLATYTFGHKDLQTCQAWVDQVDALISKDFRRPKNILVFVHPLSGKGNGCRIWESVAPIFSCAKVKTKEFMGELVCPVILFKVVNGSISIELALFLDQLIVWVLRSFQICVLMVQDLLLIVVTLTQRAGHAFDVMAAITDSELNSYDGVVAVSGT
ncbi:hypothetical protein IFM89_034501 [Coptis chinensis]|uniref:Ceramide kinase n=1 Tax=Coptis chinensis TaxID=261450 RepID=A0A835HRZ8_9MAGN|nr:hypothetical protein IFM89_034501 [Coptis chinensis]